MKRLSLRDLKTTDERCPNPRCQALVVQTEDGRKDCLNGKCEYWREGYADLQEVRSTPSEKLHKESM